MKFNQMDIKPKNYGMYIVRHNDTIDFGTYDETGWILPYKAMATGWANLPAHVAVDGNGWLSEYRGDAPPQKTGWYVVSLDCTPPFYSAARVGIGIALYVADKSHWVSNRPVLAYRK